MTTKLIAYGSYIPRFRLLRTAIADSLKTSSGKGSRAVASFDEDTTTMGVEAGRVALRGAPSLKPDALLFATSAPAYLEKTNATAIAAALALRDECLAADAGGAIRSGFAAMWSAAFSTDATLAVLSDTRTGLPASPDEKDGGDAAAAFVFADTSEDQAIASVIGRAAISAEVLDRWRLPGNSASVVWEERFGEYAYVPLARQAFEDALKSSGVTAEEIDHLIVTGPHARSVKQVIAGSGVRAEAIADDLAAGVGFTGAAHIGLMLAGVLDKAKPGDIVVAMLVSDGASALVFRVLEGISSRRASPSLQEQIQRGRDDLAYATFLTWKGFLDRQPPRRPDPSPPSPPAAYRNEDWKYGLYASECEECGFRMLPPARVCPSCRTIDRTKQVRLADATATIATFTIDRLAYSLNPPVVAAIIDFDGGGRFNVELTDVDPATVSIGQRVEMTFRKIATSAGVHNYFWKGRVIAQ